MSQKSPPKGLIGREVYLRTRKGGAMSRDKG